MMDLMVGEFENLLCNLNVVEIKFSSTVSKIENMV